MTKTKIIQQLREMLRISQKDNVEFFEEHKKKYPDTEWDCDYINSIKLGIIETKIEFMLMFLEEEMKEGERYGRQAEDLRQAVGDVEADKTAL